MTTTESPLPTKAPKLILDPTKLKYLVIAPPKWGKTTFFSGVPNCCLLAFEAGYASAECPIIVITHWDRAYQQKKEGWGEDNTGVVYTSAMEVLEELEKSNPYDFIIIDTMDMATKLASDYYCDLAKVQHPSEGGDYGRGWDLLQTSPVRKFYNRLVKLGVGVAAITHVKEKQETDRFGNDRFRRETSLPTGIQQFIHAQSDVIMHGFFSRRRKGQHERDRYLSFDGTNEVMAGTRLKKVFIPNKYVVDSPTRNDLSLPWKQWASFFAKNPEAGQLAEKEFIKLSEGIDDENLNLRKSTKQNDQEKDSIGETITADKQTSNKNVATATGSSTTRGNRR